MANVNVPPFPVALPSGVWYAYLHNPGAAIANWENPVVGPASLFVTGTPAAGAYISYEEYPTSDPTVSPHF